MYVYIYCMYLYYMYICAYVCACVYIERKGCSFFTYLFHLSWAADNFLRSVIFGAASRLISSCTYTMNQKTYGKLHFTFCRDYSSHKVTASAQIKLACWSLPVHLFHKFLFVFGLRFFFFTEEEKSETSYSIMTRSGITQLKFLFPFYR